MEINKIQLKKIIHNFLSASSRVLRAKYDIYATELLKFIRFIDNQEIIYEYIKVCGEPEYNIEETINNVKNGYGRYKFISGSTDEYEVANIYAIIKYLAENNYNGESYVYYGYSNSRKLQDKVDAFGDEFIRILITHVENYLRGIAIEMGVDDKTNINLTIENSNLNNAQVNVGSNENSININKDSDDMQKLQKLIDNLLSMTKNMNDDDKETVNECIETIMTIKEEKPKKSIIKMALSTLKGISSTAQFLAASTELAQFVENLIK